MVGCVPGGSRIGVVFDFFRVIRAERTQGEEEEEEEEEGAARSKDTELGMNRLQ
jgi:hypothetical protein